MLVSPVKDSNPRGRKTELFPSEFAAQAFLYPNSLTGKLEPLDFSTRRYMIPIYDTPNQRVLLKFGRQSEKTLVETTPVLLASGEQVPVRDVQVGDSVVTLLGDGAHLGSGTVVRKTPRYQKRCVRVTTRLGHVVEMGHTHPVRQWGRWTVADDLRVGDRVASVRGFVPTATETEDPRVLAFVGYILGDGDCIDGVGFTQDADSAALAHFRDICTSFGWKYREYAKPGSNSRALRFNKSSDARWLLKRLGLIGCRSGTKFIPAKYMRLSREETAVLVQAMWACDGHVSKKAGGLSGYEIVYRTISLQMARQMQALLWKLGIPTRMRVQTHKVYRGTEKRAYLLHVRTREGIERFLTTLRIPGKTAAMPDVASNDCRDTLPMDVSREFHRRYAALPCRHGETAHADGIERMKLRYPPSRQKFATMLEYLRSRGGEVDDLAAHNDTDLLWDEVASIEDMGEQWCYDFEVAGTHSYVAAGLVTHNSTLLGNKIITFSMLRENLQSLYVSPAEANTLTFSRDRIATPITTSPLLRSAVGKTDNNVLYKRFFNGSDVRFRNAFLNADRTRGIPCQNLVLDEIQDILLDVIPVIEETQSHSEFLKYRTYAGTPKSFDNTIEAYWSRDSTQYEWVVPCDSCGSAGKGGHRRWMMIGYDNIGLKGYICDRCGKPINPRHMEARWVSMRSAAWLRDPPCIPFDGFHVSQPMTPWMRFEEILDKKRRYTPAAFANEVLGLSYESGERVIRQQALRDSVAPGVHLNNMQGVMGRGPLFMGIDWGGGGMDNQSYTHICIGGYAGDRFVVPYWRRFEGADTEETKMMAEIFRLIDKYHVHLVGCDYGGGLVYNEKLIRQYGIQKIMRYQYVNTKKLYFDTSLHRWMANRTECLMALANAINRVDTFAFPPYDEWETPHAECFLNVFQEHNVHNNSMSIARVPGKPDDAFHALLYCLLVSMMVTPRSDIIFPDKAK